MQKQLQKAIKLREQKELRKSNELLLTLAEAYPENAEVNYQCAWSFDVLGEEAKAVPYYEKAIELGLPKEDLEGAMLGLGSTYRTLGNYEKSRSVFTAAIKEFPSNHAFQVFYSMTLYNLGDHAQAMEILLKCLAETTSDEEIKRYQKAIRFYADKLDTVWE